MTQKDKDQRAAFEAWHANTYGYIAKRLVEHGGKYPPNSQERFFIWQAAIAHDRQQRGEAVGVSSLRSCAIAGSNYAAGMLLGWNLCVDGDDESFSRIREDRMRVAAQASREAKAEDTAPQPAAPANSERQNEQQNIHEIIHAAAEPETVLTPGYLEGHKDGLEWAAQLAEAHREDAERWREVAGRFDQSKTSACERVLDALGLDPKDASKTLEQVIDAARAAKGADHD